MAFGLTALLWFCAIGCGLMGGLYFAFSTFIMTAFSRIDRASGVAAMNAINRVIIKSMFMPLFFGTTLACLALAIFGVMRWGDPGAAAMIAGGVIYVAGMFVVTMLFNVPLNNALAASDPASDEGARIWAMYQRRWTMWNHVRTIASALASILFTVCIAAG